MRGGGRSYFLRPRQQRESANPSVAGSLAAALAALTSASTSPGGALPAYYATPSYGTALRTFYVAAATGSVSYTTAQAQNSATPWATIAKCNSVATAGDHFLLKGTFSTTTSIRPAASGTSTNKIVYKNWPGFTPQITTTGGNPSFDLSGRSHVVLDGLWLETTTYYNALQTSSFIWVRNCTIRRGALYWFNSPDGRIEDCTFQITGSDGAGNFSSNAGDAIACAAGSHRVVIVRNSFENAGHMAVTMGGIGMGSPINTSCDDCTIGYNTVHNTWSGGINLNGGSNRCLVEHNDVYESARAGYSVGSTDGIMLEASNNTVRYNRVWDSRGCGILLNSYTFTGVTQICDSNKVYNNTCWANQGCGLKLGVNRASSATASVANNQIYNNLFVDNCRTTSTGIDVGYRGGFWHQIADNLYVGMAAGLYGNQFRNNRTYSPTASKNGFWCQDATSGAASYLTPAAFQAVYTTETGNQQGDPLFVSTASIVTPDLHLQSGSPAIDAGTPFDSQTYLGTAPDQGAYEKA